MTLGSQNILIVESESSLIFNLNNLLESEGFTVTIAKNGKSAIEKIIENTPDLMILDIDLPDITGFDVCKFAREQHLIFPIIILTARDEEIDVVTAFNIGADDYITKPFGVKELLARIHARLRRANGYSEDLGSAISDKIDLGDTELDCISSEVRRPDGKFQLTTKEVEILRYLAKFANEPVSRHALLEHIWKYDDISNTRTVDVHISKLRTKIEIEPNNPKYLVTLHGVGYMLKIQKAENSYSRTQ